MNTNDVTERIAQAADRTEVSAPPIDQMIRSGRRRRRVRLTAGIVSMVGIAAVGSTSFAGLVDNGTTNDPGTPIAGNSGFIRAEVAENCPDDLSQTVFLDTPGPGQTTPEGAVANVETSGVNEFVLVDNVDGVARVAVVSPSGQVTHLYKVSERSDGWWPDSYTTCRTAG